MMNNMQGDKLKRDFEPEKEKIKRPRVIGIVVLLILKGLLGGVINFASYQEITPLLNNPDYIVEGWVMPLIYFSIALAGLSIVAAVLILRYKKIGLQLGGIVIGIDLVLTLLVIVNGMGSFGLGMVINIAAFYYIYKYVTQEPEKAFFA